MKNNLSLCILLMVSLLAGCGSSNGDSGVSGSLSAPTPASSSNQGSVVVSQQGRLLKLDRDGKNAVVLTQGFQDAHPAFHPDGTDLIFVRQSANGTGEAGIFRIAPDGSGLTELTANFPVSVANLNYSWDGNRIVFSAVVGAGDQDIYLMNADGTGLIQVTSGPQNDDHPALSEDGSTVVFERGTGISTVSSAGGEVTTLTDGSSVDTRPSYCPPGNVIVFSRDGDLWALENGTLTRVTNSPDADEFHARHAPEHDQLFSLASQTPTSGLPRFQGSPDPTGDVVVMNPDGSGRRQVTNNLRASSMTIGPIRARTAGITPWAAKGPYPASFTPFSHTTGVCYGHFQGRTGTVEGDLNLLTQTEGFKMLHIYNYYDPGTSDFTVDPDMKAVLDYAVAHNIEILLGTKNSLVTSSGQLQTAAGATQYVTGLKAYLDSGVIKVIVLGNEPNAKGDANIAPEFWTSAAVNLRTALTAAGYPDLPISACLVFGGLTSYPPANAVFQADNASYSMLGYMQAINQVNPTKPFVFVNILPSYTVNSVVAQVPATASWYPGFGVFTSTTNPASNDGNIAPYWALADLQYNCVINALAAANLSTTQVYLGESGWPSSDGGTYGTPGLAASFVNGLLNLWTPQAKVPLFVFEAFDEPNQQPGVTAWGIHDKFGVLKPGIVLPAPPIP